MMFLVVGKIGQIWGHSIPSQPAPEVNLTDFLEIFCAQTSSWKTHSTKILVFSDLRFLRYRCFKFQPRGRTSKNLKILTFLFLKSQSRVTYRWKAKDKCYLSCFIHFYDRTMFRGIELSQKILTSKTAGYISSDFLENFSEGAYSHLIYPYQAVCRVLYWCRSYEFFNLIFWVILVDFPKISKKILD